MKKPSLLQQAIQLFKDSFDDDIITAYAAECMLFDLFDKMTPRQKTLYRNRVAKI